MFDHYKYFSNLKIVKLWKWFSGPNHLKINNSKTKGKSISMLDILPSINRPLISMAWFMPGLYSPLKDWLWWNKSSLKEYSGSVPGSCVKGSMFYPLVWVRKFVPPGSKYSVLVVRRSTCQRRSVTMLMALILAVHLQIFFLW